MDEEELAGGNMAGPVVRVGDTVRRAATAATPTIHRLLSHQRAAGLTWVPRAHGTDEQGREVLDFIAGKVPHDGPAWLWEPAVLDQVARALREWHDASTTFAPAPDDRWWAAPIDPVEVICHGDFAPYNHVFRDGQLVGVIDYDVCTPGPRLWDLAYTAYRYVPLVPPVTDAPAAWDRSPVGLTEQVARLNRLLDGYAGGTAELRFPAAAVLGQVVARLDALAEWTASQGDPTLDAHAAMYRAHARAIAAGALGAATLPE